MCTQSKLGFVFSLKFFYGFFPFAFAFAFLFRNLMFIRFKWNQSHTYTHNIQLIIFIFLQIKVSLKWVAVVVQIYFLAFKNQSRTIEIASLVATPHADRAHSAIEKIVKISILVVENDKKNYLLTNKAPTN